METNWTLIRIIIMACVFGGIGIAFVVKALRLHFSGRADPLSERLKERIDRLKQQRRGLLKQKKTLGEERQQLLKQGEGVDDLDWRIEDLDWRIADLKWQIDDTKWEIDDRVHQKRTSAATFWAVLGAALLALGSLAVSTRGASLMKWVEQ